MPETRGCDNCGSADSKDNRIRKIRKSDKRLCRRCRDAVKKVRNEPIADKTESRHQFEKNFNCQHPNVRATGFDGLLDTFSNDCMSFSDIAQRLQITKQAVSWIYRKYFSVIIPRRPTGRIRRRMCVLKRKFLEREEKKKGALEIIFKRSAPPLCDFLKRCDVEIIKTGSPVTLHINGRICIFHFLGNPNFYPKGYNKSCYLRYEITVSENRDFVIMICQNLGLTFVVPNNILVSRYGLRTVFLYIPTYGYSDYRKIPPKTDYWQYRDAFHFLTSSTPS